jgi:hypothetical protein
VSTFLPDVLNRWLYAEGVTVADLSSWAEVPISTMYKVVAGERDLRFEEAQRLSRKAALYKGLTCLAETMLSTAFEVCPKGSRITVNHSMDDEAADAVTAISRAREAHRAGDRRAAMQAIRDYEAIAGRMKAEASELPA